MDYAPFLDSGGNRNKVRDTLHLLPPEQRGGDILNYPRLLSKRDDYLKNPGLYSGISPIPLWGIGDYWWDVRIFTEGEREKERESGDRECVCE